MTQGCTRCRLRLPRRVSDCPFCQSKTADLRALDDRRRRALRRSPSWSLGRLGRTLRWTALLLGGPLLLPAPLVLALLSLLMVVTDSVHRQPLDVLWSFLLGVPGLLIAWSVVLPLALGLLIAAMGLAGSLPTALRSRDGMAVCIRDRRVGGSRRSAVERLEGRLQRLRDWLQEAKDKRRGRKALGVFAIVVAIASVPLVPEAIEADGCISMVSLLALGVAITGFAGHTWTTVVRASLGWLLSGPGLAAGKEDRGQQGFDSDEAALQMLALWCAGEGWQGRLETAEPVDSPLGAGAEPAVLVRLRGRVGDWQIDDLIAPAQAWLGVAHGLDLTVRAEDWVAPIPTGVPKRRDPTPELEAWLMARGIPLEGVIELAEGRLAIGAEVTLHGVETSELVAEAGYRGGKGRSVTDDESPVVVRLGE